MGSASSLLPPAKFQQPLHKPLYTSHEIQLCEKTWEEMISQDSPSPNPQYKSFRLYFYTICYHNLKDQIQSHRQLPKTPLLRAKDQYRCQDSMTDEVVSQSADHHLPLPPNETSLNVITDLKTLHTIIIFVLKLLPLYFQTIKANLNFQKYSRPLALSSNHLGIHPNDLIAFEKAFLLTIQCCYPDQPLVSATWGKLFHNIMSILVPACQRHEAQTTMKRPLRGTGGGSHLHDAPEHEVVEYFADYSMTFIFTSGDEDADNDPNSITCRLKTSY